MTALLAVCGLAIEFATEDGIVAAVKDASFEIEKGEIAALVGESGCGKSATALALRGNRIAMIFQEPMTSLNPVHTIGRQVAEPLALHKHLSAAAALEHGIDLLGSVNIADPRRRAAAYPHQFSIQAQLLELLSAQVERHPHGTAADHP